jgi:hypothetical protein
MTGHINFGDLAKEPSDIEGVPRVVAGTRRLKEWVLSALQTYGNIVLGLNAIDRDDVAVIGAQCRDLGSNAQAEKAGSCLAVRVAVAPGRAPGSG